MNRRHFHGVILIPYRPVCGESLSWEEGRMWAGHSSTDSWTGRVTLSVSKLGMAGSGISQNFSQLEKGSKTRSMMWR
jgi:hypothetical protein